MDCDVLKFTDLGVGRGFLKETGKTGVESGLDLSGLGEEPEHGYSAQGDKLSGSKTTADPLLS